MNGTTATVNDVDILATSPVYVTYGANPVGNITAVTTNGTVTLTSTATETALDYTIVLFASSTQNFTPPVDNVAKRTTVYLASNTGDDYSITGTGFTSYEEVAFVAMRTDNTNT